MVAAVLALGACTGQEPTAYGDEVRDNFVEGCVGADAAEDVCTCTYDRITEEVEFDRFKEIEDALEEDGGEVPPELTDLFAQCGVEGPLPAEGSSSTTATTEG
jgi:hypothetical protein